MFRGAADHRGVYDSSLATRFGGLFWRIQTRGPVRSSPTIWEDALYVGSNEGGLYALDRTSGALRWRRTGLGAVSSTPAVASGLVFIATARHCLAFVAATGADRWRVAMGPELTFPWGHESGDRYRSSPVIAGDLVLCGGGDGVLRAIDARTGRVRWSRALGAVIRSSPAVSNGAVYVGAADGSVYALALTDGAIRWRFDTEGRSLNSADFGFDRKTVQSSPAVVDGRVLIGARDGFFYAIDAQTGKQLWRVDHKVSWVNSSPAVVGSVAITGSSDGHFVQAVDLATGTERWRANTEGVVWSSPAVTGSLVYVGDGVGWLYAIDRTTGEIVWKWRAAGGLFSSPVIHDSALYIGSDDGGVYALALTAGAALRRAVFWDSALVARGFFRAHDAVRQRLEEYDYEPLDAARIQRWIGERLADHAPSVVVFALDVLPPTLAAPAPDSGVLRRYLESGGKVVWLGVPPLLWPRRPDGDLSLADVDRAATRRLLGVTHERSNFDPHGASATALGVRWGMEQWWIANWSADPETVTDVLAYDDDGLAAAWVRSYGGRDGSGFLRLYGVDWGVAAGRTPPFVSVPVAAELFPRAR
jgi:outer membrane protein assembly factor BamB